MNRFAFAVSCAASAAMLLGCGGGVVRTRGSRPMSTEMDILGKDVMAEVRRVPRAPENLPVHRDETQNMVVFKNTADMAVTSQPVPAPHKPGEPGDDESATLTMDAVSKNLLDDIRRSNKLVEGDLPYEDMAKLEKSTSGILIHAREIVTIMDRRATNARILSNIMSGGPASEEGGENSDGSSSAELAALDEWVKVAERVERAALWLHKGALTRSPDEVRKGWEAIKEAGKGLPQIRAGIVDMEISRK
jgi:hypothetical protein